MKWCNFSAENELAEFVDLLRLAVRNVLKKSPYDELFDERPKEFDNTTQVVSFERGNGGTPFANTSIGYSFHFKGQPAAKDYCRIGKILLSSGEHNVFVWFPIGNGNGKNDEWYKCIQKKYTDDAIFTFGNAPQGDAWVGLNEPYRSAFFSDSTSDMVSKSKLEILEDFFRAVLDLA